MTVLGRQEKIPAFPHARDYAYRCQRFFEAKTILSFVSIARFRVVREAINGFRYKCAVPRDILIDPTNACNIRCKGCWASDYDNKQHLSFKLEKKQIQTLNQKLKQRMFQG